MQEETIEADNYIDVLKVIHTKNNEYDILIDFHDRNKWIASTNITLTLISPQNNPFIYKHRDDKKGKGRIGNYIIDKTDNSIKYIYDIRKRYEYYPKTDGVEINGIGSIYLERLYTSRNDNISRFNKISEVLVENGKNKEDYDSPYVWFFDKNDRINLYTDFVYKKHGKRIVKKIISDSFIIKDRNDGGRDIFDEKTGKLCCICNIGKRYEYYLKGEFKKHLSSNNSRMDDVIIKLIPDKERVWITEMIEIDPANNPYLIKNRDDGGVDLYDKENGQLKYICNIGKRFYYIKSSERSGVFGYH
jgi:hypothetical protein